MLERSPDATSDLERDCIGPALRGNPRVQKDLKTLKQLYVVFADYGETKLRHFHTPLEEKIRTP